LERRRKSKGVYPPVGVKGEDEKNLREVGRDGNNETTSGLKDCIERGIVGKKKRIKN